LPQILGGTSNSESGSALLIVWLETGEVATSSAVVTHAPSERSSLLPGLPLRLDSGKPIQALLRKLGYISEVNDRGRYRMASSANSHKSCDAM
jgi:hypothetical protein